MTFSIRPFAVFAIVVLCGVLLFVVVSEGYYPIGMVNGTFLSSRQFRKDYRATSLYYWNTIKTYRPELEEQTESALRPVDVQSAVLEHLIETMLVRSAAKEELGDDFERLVASKVDRFDTNAELREASRTLYGLEFPDIKREILVPQAERDLLSGRLFMRGETFDAWLRKAKKESTVRIFSKKFFWEDGKVKIRE